MGCSPSGSSVHEIFQVRISQLASIIQMSGQVSRVSAGKYQADERAGVARLFFHVPADGGNLISGSSAFSKTSLNIWKFTVHVLLKPGLENFEHYFASM